MRTKIATNKQRNDPCVEDTRIVGFTTLPTPAEVITNLPNDHTEIVASTRTAIHAIIHGTDDRLLVVIGPCSIHDPVAALEYAALLQEHTASVDDALLVVMRVYFEKPRTSVGWKGLINDPGLDGSFDIQSGLALARSLLIDICALGLPCGTEFLDTVIPQFIVDTIAWGAIGARTTESQIHRELASGLSCPIGFKNGTYGSVAIAADAVLAARSPHHFLAVQRDGSCAIAQTIGNDDTHVILRGGSTGPNYNAAAIAAATNLLTQRNLRPHVMVDCSHANSGKDFRQQPAVAADVAAQIASGSHNIIGLMIESNLVEGRQKLQPGAHLVHGQSVTDGCLGWQESAAVLDKLAQAVRTRRTES